ncbi:MAG: hypothetical protein DMF31_05330 [Verrucomicrobia bacterium]|nr:MAG: hypothetical protein DMF31_05330 [Verrucomicrobiota bacterium]
MMPDDQGMSEEWIVRVKGKEYGPANLDTLLEWKAEGRLLPANDARRANVDLWITAGEIPGLFSVTPSVEAATQLTEPPVQVSRRSFNQILSKRVFPIPWSRAASAAAVHMQSVDNCLRAASTGLQR